MVVVLDKFEKQILFNTVIIENLTDGEFGTGFLIRKKMESEGKIKQLLFSNKHVFFGKKDLINPTAIKRIKITVHKIDNSDNDGLGIAHSFIMDLDRRSSDYIDHPDADTDVGCLNISRIYNFPELQLNTSSLELNDFSNYDAASLFCGQRVVFVGYPTGFYDKKNCLPVFRNGYIASIPEVDFEGKKQLLIDAQVFPGSSGSPVFVLMDGKYQLLGIIASAARFPSYVELEDVGAVSVGKQTIPIQWIGLGILYKLNIIKDIYELVSTN